MGKHSSYDDPPDKPFFCGNKKPEKSLKSAMQTTECGISPAKRSSLRSQYMVQLKDWHSLFDAGAITHDEYEGQKTKILHDLNTLYATLL